MRGLTVNVTKGVGGHNIQTANGANSAISEL
jgi:hypothetical protein